MDRRAERFEPLEGADDQLGDRVAEPATILDPPRAPSRRALPARVGARIGLRVLADVMAVSTAMFTASVIRFEILDSAPARGVDYTVITLVATPLWLGLFWLYGLYEPRQVLGPVSEFRQVFNGVTIGTVGLFVADALRLFGGDLARGWGLLVLVCGIAFVGGERLAVRKFLHFMRRRGADITRALVLGANHEGRTIARTLEREAWLGYRILGFVDDTAPVGQEVGNGHRIIGTTSDLRRLIETMNARLILVAATAFDAGRLNRLFWELQDTDVDLQITSGTIDLLASRVSVQSVAGVPLLYVRKTGMDALQRTIKRTIDICATLAGLALLAVPFAFVALWIKRDSEGPVFFKQIRIGRDGEPFTLWKLRTMFVDAEARRGELEHLSEGPGLLFKLKEDPRVTRAGRFLRRYSLDELPQIWNVLKGEMSLVGPRPALPVEVEQYDDWVRNRLKVKPGMTGLWQVSGRTETTFADYVRYDLFYIQNWSLALDLWILWRTLRAVASGEGAH